MVSVPHSGTRTLLAITGINARDQGLEGAGTWWHFGANDDLLRHYKPYAHIPIRHPLDVARSWASRLKPSGALDRMLMQYRSMFEYLKDHEATFYRMEDLPRIDGTHEHDNVPEDLERIQRFQDAVREQVIEPHREFFAQFYKDLDHGA